MKTLLSALLILSGCGMPSPLEEFEPVTGCIGPYSVPDGYRTDEAALLRNERRLMAAFTSPRPNGLKHLSHSPKAFCREFGGVHISIEPGVPGSGVSNAGGITVAMDASALLHELLHVYETEHGVFDSASHPDWGAKGYFTLDDAYTAEAEPVLVRQ